MNYLAHTLLSKNQIDYQLGNLLSDTLKGRAWDGCSQAHRDGLAMHKAIDRFTDDSPVVDRAVARLGSGYLKGVVMDITFDHFLSKHWSCFVTVSQADFIAEFYQRAERHLDALSPTGETFIRRVVDYDILNAYHTFDDLAVVLTRVNNRLSDKLLSKESATDYLPRLADKYDALEDDFLAFFPTLMRLFLKQSDANADEHYLRVFELSLNLDS